MLSYEKQYYKLVKRILYYGQESNTRNGEALSTFGERLELDMANGFPLLNARKLFYKGVLGEFTAMLKGPKTLADFEAEGCNYWSLWAQASGELRVDYGNAWLDFNGVDQIAELIKLLRTNPASRRLLIQSWNPANLPELDLPCCHYAYEFYVRYDRMTSEAFLDIQWHQRSTDVMVGLPSDVILAACFLLALGSKLDMTPGKIYMNLGNSHIYQEHIEDTKVLVDRPIVQGLPKYGYTFVDPNPDSNTLEFDPSSLLIENYNPQDPIKFLVKV